jgi:serine protease AprX
MAPREKSWSSNTIFIILAIIALFIVPMPLSAAPGGNGGGKLSGEVEDRIRAAGSDDLLPVIVQTRAEPSAAHFTRLYGRGGVLKARHASIGGYTATLPAGQIGALAEDPEVTRVSFDTPVRAHLDVAAKAVRADVARIETGGLDGRGVGVAVVDTGVAVHPDLYRPKGSPQIVEVEIVGRESGLADYFGHGTHVAGIIGGTGAASSDRYSYRTFTGVAPAVQILSLRALAPDGSGYTSDIIAAIDWAIRFRSTYNIRVLNLSLGHPIYESYATDPLCRAVRAASDAGILVVVAAGNDGAVGSGFGTISSPANEPTALTVGAMDDDNTVTVTDDVLAWYSSKGPSLVDFVVKPDVVAPGTWVVSARAAGSWIDTNHHELTLKIGEYRNDPRYAERDGAYLTLSGTSMAAPLVAGTAALMFQKEPALNAATVKARIMKSAVKDDRLIFETGAGYLDVAAALQATGRADSAPSPTAYLAEDGYVYVFDTAVLWGGDWSLGGIWGGSGGGGKFILADVPPDLAVAYGGIWGGSGHHSLFENDQVTSSGLVWGGFCSILSSSAGTADILGAVWRDRNR